jgi:hypothetical protein
LGVAAVALVVVVVATRREHPTGCRRGFTSRRTKEEILLQGFLQLTAILVVAIRRASDAFHVLAPLDTKVSLPLRGIVAIPADAAQVVLTASHVSNMRAPTKFFALFLLPLLCLQFQVSMQTALTTIPFMLGKPALSRRSGSEILSLILAPVIDLATLL